LVSLVVAVAAIGLAAPGTAPAGAAAAGEGSTTVRILSTGLEPETVSVRPGSTVVWVNESGTELSVAADDGSFNSGVLGVSQTYSYVFTSVKTVPYHVSGGPAGLSGIVAVEETPAVPDTPAAPVPSDNPFSTTTESRPTDLADTGSAETANLIAGGAVVLGGIALVLWARRRGLAIAWLGSAFARHDDLLPRPSLRSSAPRRPRPGRTPRRSRHRV
jgi:LPXTG-motif cell wall-anchored protein